MTKRICWHNTEVQYKKGQYESLYSMRIKKFVDGGGISWTICKQSAPHSR